MAETDTGCRLLLYDEAGGGGAVVKGEMGAMCMSSLATARRL